MMTPVRGLYAITPDEPDTVKLVAQALAAAAGGARVIQYRNKLADARLRERQASALQAALAAERIPLIINDDLELAMRVGAAGVHLGATDGDIGAARAALPPERLLGASCYNRLDLARAARDAGADYVAFGAAFPSTTKPGAVHASLALYAQARGGLDCPIVAIGGIDADNAPSLIAAGVDAIAVISAVFSSGDPREVSRAARRLAALFPDKDDS